MVAEDPPNDQQPEGVLPTRAGRRRPAGVIPILGGLGAALAFTVSTLASRRELVGIALMVAGIAALGVLQH